MAVAGLGELVANGLLRMAVRYQAAQNQGSWRIKLSQNWNMGCYRGILRVRGYWLRGSKRGKAAWYTEGLLVGFVFQKHQ